MTEQVGHIVITPLVNKMLGGDRRALSKLLSLIEQDPSLVPPVMKILSDNSGHSYCIAVTGPPGAGKSTIVDRLISLLKEGGGSVGVLVIDPTSQFTSGALLGDRIRMRQHFTDSNVFIRSFATRGYRGGISKVTNAAVRVLDSFGVDYVVVESVGVGQTELDIGSIGDSVVVTLVPEGGDGIQVLKAGLLDIADIIVVNKADRDGADKIANSVRSEGPRTRDHNWWTPPILLTQANRGKGLSQLNKAIQDHKRALEETGNLTKRRMERNEYEFIKAVKEHVESKISHMGRESNSYSSLIARIQRGEIDPYSAAAEAVQLN